MRLFGVGDEELGLVGVRARVCHGEDATVVELEDVNSACMTRMRKRGSTDLEGGADLIRKRLPPDALAAFARARRITCLDHEAFDVPVPQAVIIIA